MDNDLTLLGIEIPCYFVTGWNICECWVWMLETTSTGIIYFRPLTLHNLTD